MRLLEIQIHNFKNILDSTPIKIEPSVTCLVGKNESGKTFLTCVPEPPRDAVNQSVARAKGRYDRFVKSAGQAMVGDSHAAMQDLVNRADG